MEGMYGRNYSFLQTYFKPLLAAITEIRVLELKVNA